MDQAGLSGAKGVQVGPSEAKRGQVGPSRWCGDAGGERVPPVPLGWNSYQFVFLTQNVFEKRF